MSRKTRPGPARQHDGYRLAGGIPWPRYGDGEDYTDAHRRVRHLELTEERGTVQWLEWCHPGGERMEDSQRTFKATKSRPERARPGEWWAVVSWEGRDAKREPLTARHPLKNLGLAS